MMKDLLAWKNRARRKPLVLHGVRQSGKTWLMKEFAKRYYSNIAYAYFFNNNRLKSIFESDYDCQRIVSSLEIELHVKILPEKTLIVFDEIQEAPKALESLKSFCENAPQYHIVAAGSLLGVSLHEGYSYPVGKVDEMYLHPMSFSEFLDAVGESGMADAIRDGNTTLMSGISDRYRDLLRKYYYVGGMPEAVSVYAESGDYSSVRDVQNSILLQYEGDFGKHIKSSELPRIRLVWNSIPIQLSRENRKFFFGRIKEGARMKEFEISIQWLVDAGLLHKVSRVTKPSVPLKAYVDFPSFKLFMSDIGLLGAMSGLDVSSTINGNEIFTEFKGALTEQFVLQELIASGKYVPYYFSGEKSVYETDFLIQKGPDVIPVEVKAETNLKSKSLKVFCEKFQSERAVRLSMSDYCEQGVIVNYPLWMTETL